MAVVYATDSILHDFHRFQANIDQFGVVFVAVEFVNVNYTALRVVLRQFIIDLHGRRATTRPHWRLKVSFVVISTVFWIHILFCRGLRFLSRHWLWRWGFRWWGWAVLRTFFIFCGLRKSSEIVGSHCSGVQGVHCIVEEGSKNLKYIVRCIELLRVAQNFTSLHDFNISKDGMIISRSLWTSVAVLRILAIAL